MAFSGLKKRVITAILFLVVVIGTILIGPKAATILIFVIALVSAFEYEKAIHTRYLGFYPAMVIIAFALAIYIIPEDMHFPLLSLSCFTGLCLIYWVFRKHNFFDHRKFGAIITFFYMGIPTAIFSLMLIPLPGYQYLLIGVLLLIWLSDTGAYLIGSQFGKTKLLPRISPKKTVEGFLGALLTTMLGVYVINHFTDVRSLSWWVIVGFIIWLIGALGDLVQSSIKRKYGIKDSGTLLPGHGGFWDRFDSFLMVIPFILVFDKFWL